MALASLSNIEKTFGKRVIFDHASLTIYEGERIGLIGANGAGKTTLFRILSGEETADVGDVSISKGIKVGYLKQDPVFDPNVTVIDEAETAFSKLHDLSHRLRDIEHEMAHRLGDELDKLLNQYQTVQHDFELEGGYAWRHRLEATLLGVGLLPEVWEQRIDTLSGGQRSRLALAKLLISNPDLLLLDEPTNHLDLAAIEWIENYLTDFKGAVVLISHDRFLLDRLATRIAWLNQCKLDSFNGNYSSFVQQRELLELTQARQFEIQQKDIEKQQEFIRRFQAGQRSKESRGRATRLERFLKSDELVAKVADQKQIRLSLDTDQRAGDQVLAIRDLSKGYGRPLWQNVTQLVRRGERIGIIGPNGSGKTTLLRVLMGEEDAQAGNIKWGANLSIGYYDQRLDEFDPEKTVMEEVGDGREANEKQLRDVLALMLFRGDDVLKKVGLLSGGERARVRLAQLLLDRPNVFVLDEPTNHLDIASCEALESALNQFTGTILCVSHDRFFLDKVVKRMWVIDPPKIADFEGNYSAWSRKTAEKAAAAARLANARKNPPKPPPPVAPAKPKTPTRKDNPYARPFGRLTLQELEKEIQKTESKLAEYQSAFGDQSLMKDIAKSTTLQRNFDTQRKKLADLEAEYFARGE